MFQMFFPWRHEPYVITNSMFINLLMGLHFSSLPPYLQWIKPPWGSIVERLNYIFADSDGAGSLNVQHLEWLSLSLQWIKLDVYLFGNNCFTSPDEVTSRTGFVTELDPQRLRIVVEWMHSSSFKRPFTVPDDQACSAYWFNNVLTTTNKTPLHIS